MRRHGQIASQLHDSKYVPRIRQLIPYISIGICISPGCVRPGTLSGATATQIPRADEYDRKGARERLAAGQHLLDQDGERDQAHPEQAHDAQREQREHEAEAAADADGAVLDPHPQRTAEARAAAQEEVQRRAAVAQAGRLEWRQLVDAGHHERPAGDPGPVLIPGQE